MLKRPVTSDELAQLPADNPLRNLDQFLDDGRLTKDELRQLRGFRGFGPGRGHGPWGPGGGPDGNVAPEASPATGSSSTG